MKGSDEYSETCVSMAVSTGGAAERMAEEERGGVRAVCEGHNSSVGVGGLSEGSILGKDPGGGK